MNQRLIKIQIATADFLEEYRQNKKFTDLKKLLEVVNFWENEREVGLTTKINRKKLFTYYHLLCSIADLERKKKYDANYFAFWAAQDEARQARGKNTYFGMGSRSRSKS